MKSLIWKELREMALWAALIAVGLALAEGFALYRTLAPQAQIAWPTPYNISSQIDSSYGFFKLWLEVGAPIAAFVLGMLQIVPEQRRDQWAFLIHRPVTPRTIFLSKTIAGIALYACATALPLAGFTVWLLMPGHSPGPFTPNLALPDVAAILYGIPFYFAAMLVALRPARWWGSKILPLVCAATCALLSSTVPVFVYSVLIATAYIPVMFVAALGCFETGGDYDGQRTWPRIALGATFLVGAMAVVLAIGGIVQTLSQALPASRGTSFAINPQGRLVQIETTLDGDVERVFDADGRPIANAISSKDDYYYSGEVDTLGRQENYSENDRGGYSSYESHYALIEDDSGGDGQYYFYDYPNRVIDAYTIYNHYYHRPTGFLGTRGIVATTAASAGRFPEQVLSTFWWLGSGLGEGNPDAHLLFFPSAIYAFDGHAQHTSVFAVPPGGRSFEGAEIIWVRNAGAVDGVVFARAGNTVSAFSSNGSTVATFPYTKPSTDYPSVAVWVLPHPIRFFMLYESGIGASAAFYRQHPWRFVEVVPPGRVVSDTPAYPMNVYTGQTSSGAASFAGMSAMPAAVVGLGLALSTILAALKVPGWGQGLHDLQPDPGLGWTLMWICAGAAIGALIVLCLSRPYGWSRRETVKWVVGGALLSWPCVLMLLAMVPLPIRIVCASCGRKRMVSRASCEHCGAAMSAPVRDGTEIFEPMEGAEVREAVVGVE